MSYNINFEEFTHLKHNEEGEAFDLKRFYKWLLNSMPYEDFVNFAKITFVNKIPNTTFYDFTYHYEISPKVDTPRTREKFLKYLAYKLYQNLSTEGIELK